MDLAQPVGNTSESTSSMGGSSRLYSPFSSFYNPALARKIFANEVSKLARTNPPMGEAEKQALLGYQQEAASAVIIPTHAVLAVAGYIVNKQWEEATELCQKLAAYARKRAAEPDAIARQIAKEQARQAKYAAKGKKAPEVNAASFDKIFDRLAQYCACLHRGVEPVRTVASKGEAKKYGSRPVPLFDDVYRCCLAEEGNVKLPFAAYSEMPVVTCPGAGGVAGRYAQLSGGALGAANATDHVDVKGCASFCYSLKALRNPTVCYRLCVLTLGMSVDPSRHVGTVVQHMIKLSQKKKKSVKILRLFVDGDFRSAEAIEYWMEGIRQLSKHGIVVYGYSKSWPEFLEVHKKYGHAWWPTNYVLNISSGSRYYKDPAWIARMKELPFVRGQFVAVDPMERLAWKAFTKSRGQVIWAKYQNRLNLIANSRGNDAQKQRRNAQLLKALAGMIMKANPDLAHAYNEYVETIHDIEEDRNNTFSTLKDALGQPKMIPGPVVQAASWAYLNGVKDAGEWPCPISCGSCPAEAIPKYREVMKHSRLGQTELIKDLKLKEHAASVAERLKSSGAIHQCGNAKAKFTIIIGLH